MDASMTEERRLVELSKTDANAFGSLYERYYDQIFNYALRRTGNAEMAQDITAETFFKALRGIGKFS
ncbi:MAG TPA: sigma factor, partial [Bacillota bacterium]|nr:sigma factor [Bacillota bacterium]